MAGAVSLREGHGGHWLHPGRFGGFISDPVSKAKSVVFTDEGLEESKRLFYAMFGKTQA